MLTLVGMARVPTSRPRKAEGLYLVNGPTDRAFTLTLSILQTLRCGRYLRWLILVDTHLIQGFAVPVHRVGRSRRAACRWFRIFSPRRLVDLWDAFCFPSRLWLLSRPAHSAISSAIYLFWIFFWSSTGFLERGIWKNPRGVGFPSSSCRGFWPRTHCEPGLRTLALLCILDHLSFLSALGHGKRWRIHGTDLTGGIYTGLDSVLEVFRGFPFMLAPVLDRGVSSQSARHCECSKKTVLFIFRCIVTF